MLLLITRKRLRIWKNNNIVHFYESKRYERFYNVLSFWISLFQQINFERPKHLFMEGPYNISTIRPFLIRRHINLKTRNAGGKHNVARSPPIRSREHSMNTDDLSSMKLGESLSSNDETHNPTFFSIGLLLLHTDKTYIFLFLMIWNKKGHFHNFGIAEQLTCNKDAKIVNWCQICNKEN